MAKRVRLTPPQPEYLAPEDPASAGIETKSLTAPFGARAAPIAQVAGDAAASAALDRLAREMAEARAAGRLAEALPLNAILADHLVRDRIAADPEEMAALTESIRARGQQTPVDVVELGGGRFGLISGWRRYMAIRALSAETGESRFATILAVRRRPDTAGAAYVAMVEENEIRVGLGHYERARIAAIAAEQGVFPDLQTALRRLYAGASRAKRSKIGSFVVLHRALGEALRFPAAIPERLGLALVKAIETRAGFADRAAADLARAAPADAVEEQAVLARLLSGDRAKPGRTGPKPGREIAPGLVLAAEGQGAARRLVLSGAKIDAALEARLEAWLKSL